MFCFALLEAEILSLGRVQTVLWRCVGTRRRWQWKVIVVFGTLCRGAGEVMMRAEGYDATGK